MVVPSYGGKINQCLCHSLMKTETSASLHEREALVTVSVPECAPHILLLGRTRLLICLSIGGKQHSGESQHAFWKARWFYDGNKTSISKPILSSQQADTGPTFRPLSLDVPQRPYLTVF